VPSDYHFSQPLLVRVLGVFLVLVGISVAATAVLVGLLGLPSVVLSVVVAVAVLAVVVVGFLVSRRAVVVRMTGSGYRVRYVRGAGVRQARWGDVEDVVATTLGGDKCVVIRLRDGGTTTVPAGALDVDPDQFVRDLREHLDRGHGYRKLR
jgi:hypothetical protein